MAFGGQAFGHRLQVGHELGVFGDVLAHLVHKEIEAEVGRFLIQPGLDLVAEVFNGDAVLAAVLVQNAFGESWVFARDFRVGAGDVAAFKQGLFAPALPGFAGQALVGVFEGRELVAAVQVAFKLGDVALLAKVAAHLVEDFDEHRQQGIDLVLADDVGLLVDVEQDTLGRDGDGLFQRGAQQFIVSGNLGQEDLQSIHITNAAVFQHQGQHFEQVRFAGAEEARQPHAVGTVVVVVGVQEVFQTLGDFVGQYVFAEFGEQVRFVVGLDHAFNGAADGLLKYAVQFHGCSVPQAWVSKMLNAR